MEKFEKVGEFKKLVKGLVRGAVKTGVLADDGKYVFEVTKSEDDNVVTVTATAGAYTFSLVGEACTRVFNKVTPELFEPIIAQFEKLKKVESIEFTFI